MAIQTSVTILNKQGDENRQIAKTTKQLIPLYWAEVEMSLAASASVQVELPFQTFDLVFIEVETVDTIVRLYRNGAPSSEYWEFSTMFLVTDTEASRLDLWADGECQVHLFVGGS